MTKGLIKEIIDNHKSCVFVSPHFDDALLSAGALIAQLSKHVSITVINVFTKASKPPHTLSAKAFLKQCQYKDAQKLFKDREIEDTFALQGIVQDVVNLGFTDALWRKKQNQNNVLTRLAKYIPEIIHTYPTYRYHIIKGVVSKHDLHIKETIKQQLNFFAKNSVVFCPLAIGNHVDHVLVRSACEELFNPLVYWSDFPYNTKMETYLPYKMRSFSISENLNKKEKLVKQYKTQYDALFKNGKMPLLKEVFYIKFKMKRYV